jgi:cell wall-associated NlpC family hydrolase
MWGILLLRRRKVAVFTILAIGLIVLAWLYSSGKQGDPNILRQSYIQSLKQYKGTLYVWGGENRIGIDCSGLVRRGLINANIKTGLLTLNQRLIRHAFVLWWNDCSARSLRDEYRGFTTRLFKTGSINSIDSTTLSPGDLAVTSDGIHVLAYLGDKTWIEADPSVMKVIVVSTPSDNMWFKIPVQVVRWNQLKESPNKGMNGTR